MTVANVGKVYQPPFCAICGEDILGYGPYRLALGRYGALVNVCIICKSAHPRSGRYNANVGKSISPEHHSRNVNIARRKGQE